ncbi:hypothetical protein N7448_011320 [Penicillium atrosanguineum]|nr:hypothetical protein N7448_011320 [Penicillium atrosanguineum]
MAFPSGHSILPTRGTAQAAQGTSWGLKKFEPLGEGIYDVPHGRNGPTYEPVDPNIWKTLGEGSRTNLTCGDIYEASKGSETYKRFSILHQVEGCYTWKDTKDAWCAAEAGVYVVPGGKERAVSLLACGRMLT